MTSAFCDSERLKIEKSYQICAMQNVSRIFSTDLQFGILKLQYLKMRKKNLWSRFSKSSLNLDL